MVSVKNISDGKIVGIGEVVVLPGETKAVGDEYAHSASLKAYEDAGFISIIGDAKEAPRGYTETTEASTEEVTPDNTDDDSEDAILELRKSQIKALPKMNEEEVGKIAKELGINPADCKDAADVKKKVKAELTKLTK